ncbi:CAAX amino terminal protease self- immunity [Rubripirellula obstinata]|uniref:CAAX amino terminal protease self-immunity n=1 Tax=Rubripirellula obstinata TaxID=406547 RepID=A0A5B1CDY3_9BACT|nr:CPBP family intramembrane glutamic endopeptidase [Rubripirellula obstinata]KAA1258421.1 CAAX amino terminal protease self- immunity [Rubripirellula obstinata]
MPEQTTFAMQIISVMLAGLGIASAVTWVRILIKHGWRLDGLLPQRPRKLPFWNAGDALVMFGLMLIFTVIVQAAFYFAELIPKPPERNPNAEIWASVTSGAAAMAVVLMWMRVRCKDAFTQLGMPLDLSDIGLGFKASLLILPPVLLISAGVSQLVEYQHPVLDILKQTDSPIRMLGIFWCTAIVTPLVEEFLFRVLLIGGLERLSDGGRSLSPEEPAWRPTTYWPIVISSFIFAIMHFGQGAAPVPLFFLALALGYLYRRTGSITLPLIVHMTLNALTLIVETVRTNGW